MDRATHSSTVDLESFRFDWGDLPAISHDLPGTGGVVRSCPEDFFVAEIPRSSPVGEGDFVHVHIEKRDLNTHDLVTALRDRGVPYNQVGVAGLKDKHALTRQWLSVPASCEHAIPALEDLEGARVLEISRHPDPIRRGHLIGNRFEVRVRDPEPTWSSVAQPILERLKGAGLPNYFGPQRFGRFNSNAIDAVRMLQGERVPGGRRLNEFFISALQAHLFNWNLKLRIEAGLFGEVVSGDRARRHDTGGMFVVGDASVESQRAGRLEISTALPLYGRKVAGGLEEAAAMEQRVLDRFGLRRSDFRKFSRGTWRISRAVPGNLCLLPCDVGYTVEFALPAGSYATVLLRELLKKDSDPLDRDTG